MRTYLDNMELTEVVGAVITRKGYLDAHDDKFYPVEKFAGVCRKQNGEIGFLLNTPIFCINAVYINDDGIAVLSKDCISGTMINKDCTNKEDWIEFNNSLCFGKITEVLLKDGSYISLYNDADKLLNHKYIRPSWNIGELWGL